MSNLSTHQINVITKMRAGCRLRVDANSKSLNPTLRKYDKDIAEVATHTISSLLKRKLIKYSVEYNPGYHYYILTEEGKSVQL